MDWIGFAASLIKFILLLSDKFKKTPSEERRAALVEFDEAVKRAEEKKDLSEVSKWLGGKL